MGKKWFYKTKIGSFKNKKIQGNIIFKFNKVLGKQAGRPNFLQNTNLKEKII